MSATYVSAWAEFPNGDPSSKWRLLLGRTLMRTANPIVVTFIMHPSTANGEEDDPTIRRCVDFARQWQFDQLLVVNLFAYRSTDPSVLRRLPHDEAVGPENGAVIQSTAARSALVVAAWGAHGGPRGADVAQRLSRAGIVLHHLGLTKSGQPRHPLYLPRSVLPVRWEVR